MLVGYVRVSKADGSQTTDLQRDGGRPDFARILLANSDQAAS